MYTLTNASEEFSRVNQRSKELVALVLAAVTPERTKMKISSNQEVFAAPERQGKLYLLKDGNLQYMVNNKILFHFDPGDLVGVEHFLCSPSAKVASDFAVIVDEYDANTVLKGISSSSELQRVWSEYLVHQFTLLTVLSAGLMEGAVEAPPEIRALSAGDIIALEGAPSTEVFILVEGAAEATIQGNPVGEVRVGELFGLLTAMTDLPRIATITATTSTMVLVIQKERMQELLSGQASSLIKMVEDMVKTLISLNEQVVGLGLSRF